MASAAHTPLFVFGYNDSPMAMEFGTSLAGKHKTPISWNVVQLGFGVSPLEVDQLSLARCTQSRHDARQTRFSLAKTRLEGNAVKEIGNNTPTNVSHDFGQTTSSRGRATHEPMRLLIHGKLVDDGFGALVMIKTIEAASSEPQIDIRHSNG